MNPVLEAIETRRSVRAYKSDMVPKELIDQVIHAGLCAASGMNFQDSIIVAVTDPELRAQLVEMNRAVIGPNAGPDPFYGAPVVLIVLVAAERASIYDGSMVIGNMMLAAHALDLGSCWVHRAQEEFASEEGKAILKKLGVEGEYVGVGHCILGYIDGDYPAQIERKEGRVFYAE